MVRANGLININCHREDYRAAAAQFIVYFANRPKADLSLPSYPLTDAQISAAPRLWPMKLHAAGRRTKAREVPSESGNCVF